LVEIRRDGIITVWDSSNQCRERGAVFCWNGYEEQCGALSLLRYVETHGERLRRKYLAWVHDLGESRIAGKRIIDHLAFAGGLSYWWLTMFVEQSPWKSPSIIDALRLMALEEIMKAGRPEKLRLVSASSRLNEALVILCRNLGIAYEWRRMPRKPAWRRGIREFYRALPQRVQGLVSLWRHVQARWPLRQTDKSGWFGGEQAILLCSYFIHLDAKSCSSGVFHSRQWEDLPQLLHAHGYHTNWIQHFLQSNVVPDTSAASKWVDRFNQQRSTQGFHVFLDAYLSWSIVLRVLRAWLALIGIGVRLRGIQRFFQPRDSSCSFWPTMRRDWQASLGGSAAIDNLLWMELFDAALGAIPPQKTGLYLCENQSWERAFIHAWRKHGHGRVIAVAHSTVRFWDLRYFQDARTLRSQGPHAIPKPDLVALNGPAAVNSFLSVDYPPDSMVECEALRYGYLYGLPGRSAASAASGDPIRVLILGDYSKSSTLKLLDMLTAASGRLQASTAFTIKPHPNYQVKAQDFPSLHPTIVNEPLSQILGNFDIACSCNATSAAVDACLAGLPVIVAFDRTELNFSPLRGRPGVRFVATDIELAEALQQETSHVSDAAAQQDLFFLDPQFPRWKRLLELNPTDEPNASHVEQTQWESN
jgi:surface carbohydrate biosynthesis protein (TIGR04326 family)